ncbi:MAG: D-2-hydroxyacid dehydrogenase, partial [Chloroflexota bacterium]|nr:D-2-hydroxyacid dehydrogenase [Chloroflexota bacterium]
MKLLLTASEGEAYFDLLNDLPDLEIVQATTRDEALSLAGDVDVIYGLPTAELVAAAPRLRWVQSSSAGVEYVANIPALVASEVIITNTRGAHGPSIGEHTFALLLAMTRELPTCLDQQRRHLWDRPFLYRTAREIQGLTMGIIGFGAIGRGVAERAVGFGLSLIALDLHTVDGSPFVDEILPASRLNELLSVVDIVVVTTPYTPQTHHLLGAKELAQMREDAYLIVVSRGGIVDEAALVASLESGHLAGAALDVTEIEPLPAESPLW